MANVSSPNHQKPIATSTLIGQENHEEKAKKVARAASLPLSSNVASLQGEKRFEKGDVSKEKVRKTVSLQYQAPTYEWLKETEVSEPRYFVERKSRRMFLERVRVSQAQSQEEAVKADLSSPAKSMGVVKQEKQVEKQTRKLSYTTLLSLNRLFSQSVNVSNGYRRLK